MQLLRGQVLLFMIVLAMSVCFCLNKPCTVIIWILHYTNIFSYNLSPTKWHWSSSSCFYPILLRIGSTHFLVVYSPVRRHGTICSSSFHIIPHPTHPSFSVPLLLHPSKFIPIILLVTCVSSLLIICPYKGKRVPLVSLSVSVPDKDHSS